MLTLLQDIPDQLDCVRGERSWKRRRFYVAPPVLLHI